MIFTTTPADVAPVRSLSAFTMGELLGELTGVLAGAGVSEPQAEARDLIAVLCDRPRFWPTLHRGEVVGNDVVSSARLAADRRARGMPFAYAVERAAFRYFTLYVDHRVLIPRQETELLVDLVLQARKGRRGGIAADVGTGSGAIALALGAEGHFEGLIASDVSTEAIEVACINAERLHSRLFTPIELRVGSGLGPLSGVCVDVLVSNPPYIAFEEARELPASVRAWEPPLALFSADGGLALTKEILAGAPAHIHSGGLLALEVDSRRAATVAEMIAATGRFSDIRVHLDLTGRERFVIARRS